MPFQRMQILEIVEVVNGNVWSVDVDFFWKTKLDIYRMVLQVIYNEYHHCQNKKPVHGTEKIN